MKLHQNPRTPAQRVSLQGKEQSNIWKRLTFLSLKTHSQVPRNLVKILRNCFFDTPERFTFSVNSYRNFLI